MAVKQVPFKCLWPCLIPHSAIYIQCQWRIVLSWLTRFPANHKEQTLRPEVQLAEGNNAHTASADRFLHSHSVTSQFTRALPPLAPSHPGRFLSVELDVRCKHLKTFLSRCHRWNTCPSVLQVKEYQRKAWMQLPDSSAEVGMHVDKKLSRMTDRFCSKWLFMRVQLFGNMSLNRLPCMLSICKVGRKAAS